MPAKVEGKVTAIKPNGDIVTDIACARLEHAPRDNTVKIEVSEHETFGLFPENHDEPEMTFLAILSKSGNLELTIVGDSARLMLGVSIGEDVVVTW